VAPDGTSSDVVERIQNGERSAEVDLVRRFYGPVFSMVFARTRDREVAKDLRQVVMMSVISALRDGKLQDANNLVGYICGTMRNQVRYYFRSQHFDRIGEIKTEPVLEEMNPEEIFETEERQSLANLAIEQLPVADRRILRMSLIEGLSPKEIGERLKMKSEVVRQRKSRAIRKAQKILRAYLSRE